MNPQRPNPCPEAHLEALFVRNIEQLQEQQVFLVMRDKLSSQSLEDESLVSSPFSMLRFRVAHSDRYFSLMVDSEASDAEDCELLFTLQLVAERELTIEALAGGEQVSGGGVRSFSSQQHPSLGGGRKWRIILLPLESVACRGCKSLRMSINVRGEREGSFTGVVELI